MILDNYFAQCKCCIFFNRRRVEPRTISFSGGKVESFVFPHRRSYCESLCFSMEVARNKQSKIETQKQREETIQDILE